MLLVLFDIDGTLLLSDGVGRRSLEIALERVCGCPINSEMVSFSGRTDPAIVRDILIQNGLNPKSVEQLIPACLHAYATLMSSSIEPANITILPGVRTLLNWMNEHSGVQLGVLTGNLESTAAMKLAAGELHPYFSIGAYGSDNEERNHLPAVAHERAQAHWDINFQPEQLVIIGDTQHDIGCAQYFGALSIAVPTGQISSHELQACKPDLLVEDLTEIDRIDDFLFQSST